MSQPSDILRLGARNVLRNRRRSAFTASMIAVGVAAIVFFRAYIAGLGDMMLSQVVENVVGALQVERVGYADAVDLAPLDLDLPQDPVLLESLRATPGVRGVTPRLRFGALLFHGEASTVVAGLGLDPEGEKRVCPKGIGAGAEDRDASGEVYGVTGAGLQRLDEEGIVVGVDLARGLGIEVGDTVTLLAQTQKSSTDAVDAKVVGLFRTGDAEANKRMVAVPLPLAQRLLHMPDRVTSFVLAAPRQEIAGIAERLRPGLLARAEPTTVRTWEDLAPYYRDVLGLQNDLMRLVTVLFFVLVLAGVVNTMTMAAFERQREVGTLLALGFRRRAILWMFLVESAVLGIAAGVVGAGLGVGVVALTRAVGLPFFVPGVGTVTNHPALDTAYVVLAPAAALAGAALASLLPAWRASRLQPVEALRAT